jgi:hypothetical protein
VIVYCPGDGFTGVLAEYNNPPAPPPPPLCFPPPPPPATERISTLAIGEVISKVPEFTKV